VNTSPIDAYLNGSTLPILGDNPRRPDERHHFSAARVALGTGESGYLYVVLQSTEYESAAMGLQQRYVLQALRQSMLTTVPLAALLGLVLFLYATRPLQRLTRTVRSFGAGDYTVRSSIASDDEIGDLARNFNGMADTITDNLARLEHADRERRELIANISHDLRNPLATVQGYLETVSNRDETLSPEARRRYYDILLNATRSLPRLVDDLFELSRLEAPDATPKTERFSLSELVQDVTVQWKEYAADSGIDLRMSRPDALYFVEANVGMIERALANLIRNAIAHTPEDGLIEVSLDRLGPVTEDEQERQDGDAVRVVIADSGAGIAADDQQRVFERFFIADPSRSRSRHGSGLGLAICKRIVELHGGDIGVESERGAGSRFYFVLPLSRAEESP
jgi:signal transduction histidine kinase